MAPTSAGWYPDPSGTAHLRYFDGTRWTENLSDAGGQRMARYDGGTSPQGHTGTQRSLLYLVLAIVAVVVAVAGFFKLMSSGGRELVVVGVVLSVVFAIIGAALIANLRRVKPALRPLLRFLVVAIVGYLIAVIAFVLQVKVSFYYWSDIKYPGMLLFFVGIIGAAISAIMVAARSRRVPQPQSPAYQQTGPAPGWYPDARDPGLMRYFDGRVWTSSTSPRVQR